MHMQLKAIHVKEINTLLQEQFGPLSAQELATMGSCFYEETLEKQDFFTQSGQVCNKLSFVKSGILRVYALADGKEITQWISTENYLLTEAIGFFFDQPNRWNIQALTQSELLSIQKSDYQKLGKEFPKWKEIEKRFLLKCFAMLEDRIFTHLSMTAEERYDLYFEQNRDLFNRVPLQHIASVLGMTPETFSRIRKRQSS
jgi:CRP/FNR family transcriptional regulator, anaerobic regulatory protein